MSKWKFTRAYVTKQCTTTKDVGRSCRLVTKLSLVIRALSPTGMPKQAKHSGTRFEISYRRSAVTQSLSTESIGLEASTDSQERLTKYRPIGIGRKNEEQRLAATISASRLFRSGSPKRLGSPGYISRD